MSKDVFKCKCGWTGLGSQLIKKGSATHADEWWECPNCAGNGPDSLEIIREDKMKEPKQWKSVCKKLKEAFAHDPDMSKLAGDILEDKRFLIAPCPQGRVPNVQLAIEALQDWRKGVLKPEAALCAIGLCLEPQPDLTASQRAHARKLAKHFAKMDEFVKGQKLHNKRVARAAKGKQ